MYDLIKILTETKQSGNWEPSPSERRFFKRMSRRTLFNTPNIHVYIGNEEVKVNPTWLDSSYCRSVLAVVAVDASTEKVVSFGQEALLMVRKNSSLEAVWPFKDTTTVSDLILLQSLEYLLREADGQKRHIRSTEFLFYVNDHHNYSSLMRLVTLAQMAGFNVTVVYDDIDYLTYRFGVDYEESGKEMLYESN